jgi:hypothetical protein
MNGKRPCYEGDGEELDRQGKDDAWHETVRGTEREYLNRGAQRAAGPILLKPPEPKEISTHIRK